MKTLVTLAALVIATPALATDQIGDDAAKLAAEKHSGRGHSLQLIDRMARVAADERGLEGQNRQWFLECYAEAANDMTPEQVDRLRQDIATVNNYSLVRYRSYRQALAAAQRHIVQKTRHAASLAYGLQPATVAKEKAEIRSVMAAYSRVHAALRDGHAVVDKGRLKLAADMPPALQPAEVLRPAF